MNDKEKFSMMHSKSMNGRVWWPAGLESATPDNRSEALERGWWFDGSDIVTREGRRLSPVENVDQT